MAMYRPMCLRNQTTPNESSSSPPFPLGNGQIGPRALPVRSVSRSYLGYTCFYDKECSRPKQWRKSGSTQPVLQPLPCTCPLPLPEAVCLFEEASSGLPVHGDDVGHEGRPIEPGSSAICRRPATIRCSSVRRRGYRSTRTRGCGLRIPLSCVRNAARIPPCGAAGYSASSYFGFLTFWLPMNRKNRLFDSPAAASSWPAFLSSHPLD